MKEYEKKNRRCFAGALVSVLISTVFAVVLQFFKGDVLGGFVWLALCLECGCVDLG